MKFIFKIDCDNAAFQDVERLDNEGALLTEIGRILREAAEQVEGGYLARQVLDINGNTVGKYALQP